MTLQINSNVDANLARQDNINYSEYNNKEGENPILSNYLNNESFIAKNFHTNFLNNAYRSSEVVNTNYHNIASTNYPNNVCLSHDCILDGNHNKASIDCITSSSVNSNTSIYAELYLSISKLAYKFVLLSNVFISSFLCDVHSVYFDEEK